MSRMSTDQPLRLTKFFVYSSFRGSFEREERPEGRELPRGSEELGVFIFFTIPSSRHPPPHHRLHTNTSVVPPPSLTERRGGVTGKLERDREVSDIDQARTTPPTTRLFLLPLPPLTSVVHRLASQTRRHSSAGYLRRRRVSVTDLNQSTLPVDLCRKKPQKRHEGEIGEPITSDLRSSPRIVAGELVEWESQDQRRERP